MIKKECEKELEVITGMPTSGGQALILLSSSVPCFQPLVK